MVRVLAKAVEVCCEPRDQRTHPNLSPAGGRAGQGLGANLNFLLSVSETELQFCARCKEIGLAKGGPHVLIPMFLEPPETWHHGNESWQDKGF
jgi:hypothetical protein